MKRLLVIAALGGLSAIACLSACAATGNSQGRAGRIVENIRAVTVKGFSDVTIDYVKPVLKVTGHAYSHANARISSLMRAIMKGGGSPALQELRAGNASGRRTTAFTIVVSGVGNIQNWSGPIILKFPLPSSAANGLAKYPLKDLVFIGTIVMGGNTMAVVEMPDKHIYRLRKGDRIGSENALIKDISGGTLTMQMSDGETREIPLAE